MSDGPTAWADSTTAWRLTEDLRLLGEEGQESELVNPQSLAVDAAGRIYVADRKPAVIKQYGPDGRLHRTIGREGEGPGEFRASFLAIHGAHLVLHDPRLSRTSVFDTSGTFLRSWSSSCCYWTAIHVDREGLAYIPGPSVVESRGTQMSRFRLDGSVVDTVWTPRGGEWRSWVIRAGSGQNRTVAMTSVPFTPQVRYGFHPDGGFVVGWSGEYLFRRSTNGHDTVRVFGRTWSPAPVTDAEKRAITDSMVQEWSDGYDPVLLRSAFRADEIPSTRPAFEGLAVDQDGNVWVRVGPAPSGGLTYDIFDADGAWLGSVRFPITFSPWGDHHFGRDAVVVLTEDEGGRPAVVRYRIRKPLGD
jgi:hypothetical protein